MHLHGKARKTYFEKCENSEAVGIITDETFSLWIAASWRVARDLCLKSIAKGAD